MKSDARCALRRGCLPLSIVVTGANGDVGRKLLPELAARGHRVVALVRDAAKLPADSVITGWMTSPEAERALADSDAVVHLAGLSRGRSATDFENATVATARRVAEAVRTGRPRRIVFLSYPGADPLSPNHYLRTKAEAERVLQDSGREVVVFRATHMIDLPDAPGPMERAYSAENGGTVRLLGNGRQRWRPILRADVVNAIASAVERGRPGVYTLAGDEEMSADELVRLINAGRTVKLVHTPPWLARLVGLFTSGLPPTFVDIMSADSTGDPQPAVREFGLTLTLLRSVWRPGTVRLAEVAVD